jgi:tRNA pseudouridine55 synthase
LIESNKITLVQIDKFNSGFINLYKQNNMSSVKTTLPLKKIIRNKKIGHIGTLDPAAEGVLPIAIGKATRLIEFILQEHKTYKAMIQFGIETDSLDATGNIVKTKDAKHVTEEKIKETIPLFIGDILQTPPAFSAIKVSGKRAYQIARNGEIPKLSARKINVKSIKLIKFIESDSIGPKVELEIECSSGFYVRAFAKDLGTECNTLAILNKLQRTSVSGFNIKDSHSIEEIQRNITKLNNYIIPMESILKFPEVRLNDSDAQKMINGNFIQINNNFNLHDKALSQFYSCFNHKNVLLGIVKLDLQKQLLKPFKVLFE